ncbi:hypothetical protein F5883DRAFT_183419 [Diaporthe sp. PMI_573]|nr:hypothetical protein F5883DRAFT_183419 [Diaporthaceae sp. PMI_573]
MKGAQHRSDTILGALAELGQAHDVFRRLWGGETFETIYESFDSHRLVSPAPGQTPEAWSQSGSVEAEKASWTSSQTFLCFPPIPDCSYSHGSEASHIRGAINQHAVPANTKEESAGPSTHFNASMFNNMALPDSMSEYGAMKNDTAIMPHGEFMDRNTWM